MAKMKSALPKALNTFKSKVRAKSKFNKEDSKSELHSNQELVRISGFPIVAIGASAGGLEAVTLLLQIFRLLQAAFIYVQHLSQITKYFVFII
jgi:chemotaxis response regulator CheB